MDNTGVHRPRNVDWKRAAGLLYGDWGTSKAYVIGLAFAAAGFGSFPIILAVCALTGLVGYNYIVVCRHFPDGGGVYSAAREQSRVLAVLGSLLLLADFIVTASLSCWSGMEYFQVPRAYVPIATIGVILFMGALNYFGPKHSGSFAVSLALPMVVVVIVIIALSLPHLTLSQLEPPHTSFSQNWKAFVGVILALSGVEAIANLTGVMKLNKEASPQKPNVSKTATKAIVPVALEVVLGTALLAWAMLSLPREMQPTIEQHRDDMLRFVGNYYGDLAFGHSFGVIFGVVIAGVVGLLLLSATNTAVTAMIGLLYMLARDREMPKAFTKLNSFGVPWLPMVVAVGLPMLLVAVSSDLVAMADMYAIGVVGAITVNLGSCAFNKKLKLNHWEFAIMLVTFLLLFVIEISIAKDKPAALFYAVCVLMVGFGLRWWAMKRAGLETVTVHKEVAAAVSPEKWESFNLNLNAGQTILVAARGLTPVLRYAMEEARLRNGSLYVLFVKELAVNLPGPLVNTERPRWQDDPRAAEIMYGMLEMGQKTGVSVVPLYAVSENAASTILDLSATIGVDILVLGSAHRSRLVALLKGDVVTEVARNLPENIQLVIYG
jgi:amino acid transporter/nucleotide-binding universal stress UspA family protein